MTAHPVTADVSVRESGVDWLTATCNTRWRLLALRDLAVRMGAKLARAGYDVRDARRLGYVGWTVGQLTYGERQDGAMCVLSGAAASEWWGEVVPRASNVTRLDVQVTVGGLDAGAALAERHEREAIAHPATHGRPAAVSLTRQHQAGQTLYLGSRASESYCRCYDKHHESPADYPAGTWRYEVEYKGQAAAVLARGLLDAGASRERIPSVVWERFRRHGVAPLFDPALPAVSDRHSWPISDDERRLRWLRDDVARTVRKLIEVGRETDAREALGLNG